MVSDTRPKVTAKVHNGRFHAAPRGVCLLDHRAPGITDGRDSSVILFNESDGEWAPLDPHTLAMLERRLLHETDPDVLAAIGLALVEHTATCPSYFHG